MRAVVMDMETVVLRDSDIPAVVESRPQVENVRCISIRSDFTLQTL